MNLWLSLSVNCRDRHAPTISADSRSHFHCLSESPLEDRVSKSSLETSAASRISIGAKNLFKQLLRKLKESGIGFMDTVMRTEEVKDTGLSLHMCSM